jgi:hypothetical protein
MMPASAFPVARIALRPAIALEQVVNPGEPNLVSVVEVLMEPQFIEGAGAQASATATFEPEAFGKAPARLLSRFPSRPEAADGFTAADAALIVLARLLGRQAARDSGRRPGHSSLTIVGVLMVVSLLLATTLLVLRTRLGH